MSFSQQVKKEIALREPGSPCCALAACYGIACFAKSFDAGGLVMNTESAFVAQWAKRVLAGAGVAAGVVVKGKPARSYELTVRQPFETEKLLVALAHTGSEPSLRIGRANLECENCLSCFAAAAFMCAGVAVNPEKSYALEFVSSRYSMMRDFAAILAERGFDGGSVRRKGVNVLYFKASEQVKGLLALMGAPRSALEIMNLKVYKDFRNKANRITNCETANIDKIVLANRRILDAIVFLERCGAMEVLPRPLRDAAALRRANPALSLAELAYKSAEPVSKSGLSHRYRKIMRRAEDLKNAQPCGGAGENSAAAAAAARRGRTR